MTDFINYELFQIINSVNHQRMKGQAQDAEMKLITE